jgi:hypothetical protein
VSTPPMPTPPDPSLAALAQPPAAPPVKPTSRYVDVGTATYELADGTLVTYLRRRFVPLPERYSTIGEHRVADGERLDVITAQLLGDPTQFWRLCDANLAMRPEELEQPDRVLRVTLPEGIGAPDDA